MAWFAGGRAWDERGTAGAVSGSGRLLVPLRRAAFRRAFTAQAVNLLGDGLTWVGLALLARDIAGGGGGVLAVALIGRVATYVLVAPWAGVVADRVSRRGVLVVTCLARMLLVLALVWVETAPQLVGVVVALNVLAAFYTPTFNASIPLLVPEEEYGDALALSSATYEILGLLGPAVAAGVLTLADARTVFVLDAATFLAAAALLLPVRLPYERAASEVSVWTDVRTGTRELYARPGPRTTLLFELAAALAGAAVLVGSVGLIRDALGASDTAYAAVMTCAGLGAALAALASGWLVRKAGPARTAGLGALLAALAVVPAAHAAIPIVGALWVVHGAGISLVGVAAARAIVAEVPAERHGRAFGAHFAWSHAWWLIGYPLAGVLSTGADPRAFLPLGVVALALVGAVALASRRVLR